jgi:hypothetical protein
MRVFRHALTQGRLDLHVTRRGGCLSTTCSVAYASKEIGYAEGAEFFKECVEHSQEPLQDRSCRESGSNQKFCGSGA